MIERKQSAFLETIGNAAWPKCEKLVSEHYADQWKLTRTDLLLVFKDIRSQFLSVAISLRNGSLTIDEGHATYSGFLHLEGRGLGIGAQAQSEIDRLEDPFSFQWDKESILPWSWKLVRVEHPTLEKPEGYQPGDLIKMRDGAMDLP